MRRSRWKANKGIMALLLSALMILEPVGTAATVYAEEGTQTPQVTNEEGEMQEPGTDETPADDTETTGQEPENPEQNEGEQGNEEDRDTQEEGGDSSVEDTDKKDESDENPSGNEGDNEQGTEPGDEDSDGEETPDEETPDGEQVPDVENPDGEEAPDEEDPDSEETDEDETLEEEEVEEDKEAEENKALNGFTGMPDDYKLSASQMEKKRSIAANIDDLEDYQEGSDYETGELVTSAESMEEAEMIARAYNAEIIELSWGILTLKLNKGFTVEQAVRVAADTSLNMPAVWPNYFFYASGEEPISVESIEIETSEYEADDSTPEEENGELSYMNALTFSDPYLQVGDAHYQYHHEVIGSSYAWAEGYTGSGIKVAVLDTGMNGHDDLPNVTALMLNNMSEYYPDYGDSETLPDVNDIMDDSDSGHGTHVAGIIAAKANNGMGAGVAPDVQLFIGKALPNNGSGNLAYAMRGIRAAVDQNVDIINMSLGSPSYIELFQDVVDEAYNKGVAIFAAAGNDSRQDSDYPACYNHVISVAATDRNNERAGFSNYNKMVDLSAPGMDIWSTSNKSTTEYVSMSGTSMACPVAAGEAAVILSGNASIRDMARNGSRVDALEKLMKANAIKAGSGMGSGITSLPKVFKLSTASTKPSAPTITISPDNEAKAQKVDVTIEAQNGMTIYYTTNGKNPAYKNGEPDAKAGTVEYVGSFEITESAKATIKAIAVNESGVSSAVKSASFTLKPYVTSIEITGIQEVMPGKSIQLKAEVMPAYATNKKVTWTLLDEQGQKITGNVGLTIKNGKVTAARTAATGKYNVQVTAQDEGGKQSALYPIEVIDSFKVSKVSFTKTSVPLVIPTATSYDLWTENTVATAVKENDVLTANHFKWTSSNKSIAIVNAQGVVTPLKAGTVSITALANDSSGKKASCKISIKQLAESFIVTGPSVIAKGKNGTFKAEAVPATTSKKKVTWELYKDGTKVESGPVTINAGNGKVTVSKDVSTADTYTVKAVATDGGSAVGEATFSVANGIITRFTLEDRANAKITLRRKNTVFGTDQQTEAEVKVKVDGDGTPNLDAYKVTSSNPGIATATGVRNEKTITLTIRATGKAAGKTNIVLASTDGSNKKITCAVTVVNPISSIGVAPAAGNNNSVAQGKSLQIKAMVNSEHGSISNKGVTWELYTEDGMKVDSSLAQSLGVKIAANGKVTAAKNAKAYELVTMNVNGEPTQVKAPVVYTVKATAKDGSGVYGTCTINVGEPASIITLCQDPTCNWNLPGASYNWSYVLANQNECFMGTNKLWGLYERERYRLGLFGDVNAFSGSYIVSSSNPSVVTVTYNSELILFRDEDGSTRVICAGYVDFSANKKGSATITIKATDGSGKQVKYKLKVE